MKKHLQLFSPFLLVFLLLFGCSTNDTINNNESANNENNAEQSEENAEETVHIVISEDKGEPDESIIADEEIDIEEGDILLDVLNDHFDVEENDGFINSIEGVEDNEDEGKFWMYDVNGEMAPVGANEYELNPGDEVEFDLQEVE